MCISSVIIPYFYFGFSFWSIMHNDKVDIRVLLHGTYTCLQKRTIPAEEVVGEITIPKQPQGEIETVRKLNRRHMRMSILYDKTKGVLDQGMFSPRRMGKVKSNFNQPITHQQKMGHGERKSGLNPLIGNVSLLRSRSAGVAKSPLTERTHRRPTVRRTTSNKGNHTYRAIRQPQPPRFTGMDVSGVPSGGQALALARQLPPRIRKKLYSSKS